MAQAVREGMQQYGLANPVDYMVPVVELGQGIEGLVQRLSRGEAPAANLCIPVGGAACAWLVPCSCGGSWLAALLAGRHVGWLVQAEPLSGHAWLACCGSCRCCCCWGQGKAGLCAWGRVFAVQALALGVAVGGTGALTTAPCVAVQAAAAPESSLSS